MDYGPLVRETIDAGEGFAREFDATYPVKAAFWLKVDEDDYWHLYIASDKIRDTNLHAAYGEVVRLAHKGIQARLVDFDPYRVKLLSGDSPMALAAAEIQEKYPALLPMRLGGSMFGGQFVTDGYLYPPLKPAAVP